MCICVCVCKFMCMHMHIGKGNGLGLGCSRSQGKMRQKAIGVQTSVGPHSIDCMIHTLLFACWFEYVSF